MTDPYDDDALYEHQVGGHGTITRSATHGDRLWKVCNRNEITFYQDITNPLHRFTATYHSHVIPSTPSSPRIELQDINASFSHPCVLDLKVGTRHYDDDATPAKIARARATAAATTTGATGLRVVGAQVWRGDEGGYERRSKKEGKALVEGQLQKEIEWFMGDNVKERVNEMKLKVIEILNAMEGYQKHNFYSSSLLVAYDGNDNNNFKVQVNVTMIDFAHTVPVKHGKQRDDGYVFGLRYLLSLLDAIDGTPTTSSIN